jgi:dTDP-4-dehydrorhamnose reductase
MSKILVTGANGQLGNELRKLAKDQKSNFFTFIDIQEVNLLDQQQVDSFFDTWQFDIIINCAAYTAVDKAEQEKDLADKVNGFIVKTLAEQANRQNASLIHVSTDFVFDGLKSTPYFEDDIPAPQSAYAQSKLLGETMFLENARKGFLIRTSWLYSEYGHNFVKTIMKYGAEREELKVVFNQAGTPTYAYDLAKAILAGINSSYNMKDCGIFHFSNEGVASWYDFAVAVIQLSGISCKIIPIEEKDYPLPAKRPAFSVMNKAKIKETFNIEIPYWRDSLEICIKRIKNNLNQ